MLDEIESKTVHKAEKVIDRGKRSKTLSEVKPVENISKNLQSFLEINPVQKEVFACNCHCSYLHIKSFIHGSFNSIITFIRQNFALFSSFRNAFRCFHKVSAISLKLIRILYDIGNNWPR